jgi:hypothetical protein
MLQLLHQNAHAASIIVVLVVVSYVLVDRNRINNIHAPRGCIMD